MALITGFLTLPSLDGRIAAATRGGVFIGDGSSDPKTFTYVDGVPGVTAYNLVVDSDGALWVRSDAGLAAWYLGHWPFARLIVVARISTHHSHHATKDDPTGGSRTQVRLDRGIFDFGIHYRWVSVAGSRSPYKTGSVAPNTSLVWVLYDSITLDLMFLDPSSKPRILWFFLTFFFCVLCRFFKSARAVRCFDAGAFIQWCVSRTFQQI